MTFTKNFKNALRMFRLNEKAMQEISQEKDAGWWGIIFIAIAGFCFGVSMLILNPSYGVLTLIGAPVLMLITSFIGISILFLLAKLVGGKGSWHNYFRSYSHMYIFNWIAIIPLIGPFLSSIIGVWQVIMAIYITKVTMHLQLGKSAAIVLVPVIIAIILVLTATLVSITLFLKYFITVVQPVAQL